MRISVRLLSGVLGVILVAAAASQHARGQTARPTITTAMTPSAAPGPRPAMLCM